MNRLRSALTRSAPLAWISLATRLGFGVLATVLVVQAWGQFDLVHSRDQQLDGWSGADEYGVFYPLSAVPGWQEDPDADDKYFRAVDQELYPVVNTSGAIYIDASEYDGSVIPSERAPHTLRVNTNYLARYPLVGADGDPVSMADTEQDWVVAVPDSYKRHPAAVRRIRAYIQEQRTGHDGMVKASNDSRSFDDAPARFDSQKVKIVWTRSNQKVFTFNSDVNPAAGNTVVDPIVEILTAGNTLPIAYMNTITGGENPALKAKLRGTPEKTLASLRPTIEQAGLGDELRTFVTANEAARSEFAFLRTATVWTLIAAAMVLAATLGLGVGYLVITTNRTRRRVVVRRLHGHSRVAAHRMPLLALAAVWGIQSATALPLALTFPGTDQNDADLTTRPAEVLAVVIALVALEAAAWITVLAFVERRHNTRRLKEL